MWQPIVCLVWLSCYTASAAALLRHDQKVRADGVQEKDLLDMLASLNEVVAGMDRENKAFRDLSAARETACQTTKANLEKSMKKGNDSLQTAQKEMSDAMSEVDSIQGAMNTMKKQMKAIDGEISDLKAQLAKLRADRVSALLRDSGSQHVKAMLENAQQRISKESQASEESVSDLLQRLEESEQEDGNSLVSVSESHDDDPKRTEEASKKVFKASKTAREVFELKELKLLDLIKAKHEALKALEGKLEKQQPEMADQLRKISEANRSVAMTKHALKRDQKILDRSEGKCAVVAKAKDFEESQRPQVRVQVIMAISFLKAMARKSGISLNAAKKAASFLQFDRKESEESEADAVAFIESDDVVSEALDRNRVQVDSQIASSEAGDSLKGVKETIADLISSLREEQNKDQGKQTFCAEQLKKEQEKIKMLKTAQEAAEKAKSLAENDVKDLEERAQFAEGEVKLLKEAKTDSQVELDAEVKRVQQEVKNHEATTDVMSKSQEVLVTQCKLSKDDMSSNCAEANAALTRASKGLQDLDKYLGSYLDELRKVTEKQQAEIAASQSTQESSLFQARKVFNRRKGELAQLTAAPRTGPCLEEDVGSAKEQAILASKAESALAVNCGLKVSSAEELMATRKEQIEQLKNAVEVLDG